MICKWTTVRNSTRTQRSSTRRGSKPNIRKYGSSQSIEEAEASRTPEEAAVDAQWCNVDHDKKEETLDRFELFRGSWTDMSTIPDKIITCRLFSVFGILTVIQAVAEIFARINFACNSRGGFAL